MERRRRWRCRGRRRWRWRCGAEEEVRWKGNRVVDAAGEERRRIRSGEREVEEEQRWRG